MASTLPPDLGDLPLVRPPPGLTPNFEDPTSIAVGLSITGGIYIALVIVFAGIRFYAKLFSISQRTWDDGMFPSRHRRLD